MGDKTQIATAGLAIRFENLPLVVAGSTLGMMLVNAPAVLLGEATPNIFRSKAFAWPQPPPSPRQVCGCCSRPDRPLRATTDTDDTPELTLSVG